MNLSFLTNDDPLSGLQRSAFRILGARGEEACYVVAWVFILDA